MAALPIGLIKGHRNVRNERLQITDKKSETTAKIAAIRNKVFRVYCTVLGMSLMVRKPVFGVFNLVKCKLAFSANTFCIRLEI